MKYTPKPKPPRASNVQSLANLKARVSEHDLQCLVVAWARLMSPRHPELELLHATPNGGHRHISVGRKLKAEGVRPGYPDLSLDVAAHGYHGLRMELKTMTGRLSPEQAWWLDKLDEAGYLACVCRGTDAAIDTIKSYLGMT